MHLARWRAMTTEQQVCDGWSGQMIHQAAIYNNAELMACLLQGDELENINSTDNSGRTALYTAVSNGSHECVETLLKFGADPNLPSGPRCNNMTPLHLAVKDRRTEAVHLLLEAGADLSITDSFNLTVRNMAEFSGHNDILTILKKEDGRRRTYTKVICSDFFEACERCDVEDAACALKKLGPKPESVIQELGSNYCQALSLACKNGQKELVEVLLMVSMDLYYLDVTPLHLSCDAGHLDIVRLLLEKYPEITSGKGIDGKLPLHYAAKSGHMDIVKLLYEFPYPKYVLFQVPTEVEKDSHFHLPFNPNLLDQDSKSPLYYACAKGYQDIAKYIVNYKAVLCYCGSLNVGSDTNGKEKEERAAKPFVAPTSLGAMSRVCELNRDKSNPLKAAVEENHEEIVLMLVHANQEYSFNAKDLTDCLMMACEKNFVHLVDILLQYGARDDHNKVYLVACLTHDEALIEILLKHKSVRDAQNHINKSQMLFQFTQRSLSFDGSDKALISTDLDYQEIFPVNPVSICWQDLSELTKVKEEWLAKSVFYHNPSMKQTNLQLAMYAITSLDLKNCRLVDFPSPLLSLPSLCMLDLSHNSITAFPKEIPELLWPSLVTLLVKDNRLMKLQPYLFKLCSLRFLNVSHNELENIPVELWDNSCLWSANFSHNNIHFLECPAPVNPVVLPKWGNKTSPVSSIFGNSGSETTQNKQHHSIGINDKSAFAGSKDGDVQDCSLMFSTLQNERAVEHSAFWIGRLKVGSDSGMSDKEQVLGLRDLNLSHNYLKDIPQGLACYLPHLEVLNLSENNISRWWPLNMLPAMLQELDLSNNLITNMSSCFTETGCDVRCYSQKAAGTSRKTSISSSFHLGNICPHRKHEQLLHLQSLNLANNRLLELCLITDALNRSSTSSSLSSSRDSYRGSEISTASTEKLQVLMFPNLSSLDLSHNRLVFVAKEIGQLSQLKMLNLSYNKIRELPPEMGMLDKLWKLDLEKCYLEGAIQDMILQNRPVSEITGFLSSVLEEASEYCCLNLMLVGAHNVGKTTLLHQLRKMCKTPKNCMPQHWVQRVGNVQMPKDKLQRLSTVGIDMGQILVDKSSMGPITFRTWDFGGQREYYATHRYFLLKRSLYLVVWKMTDGEKGVCGILQWLINIQAQAPGSSVIIIGTHLDVLKHRSTRGNYPPDFEESMNLLIRKHYFVHEPDKSGLPNVIDIWNVSCITGNTLRKLLDKIYNHAFNLPHPCCKRQILVKQKIPRKYLLLEEIVKEIAKDRIGQGKDPVVSREHYKILVMNKMLERNVSTFRDVSELDQATRFLHENGVLCHYDDSNLSDRYFLDPQWLCDQLARVVTIPEVNTFAANGVMKMESLRHLYKELLPNSDSSQEYMLDLLGKFELALQFDDDKLLIPSLLKPSRVTALSKHKSGQEVLVKLKCSDQYIEKQLSQKRQGSFFSEEMFEDISCQVGTSRFYYSASSDECWSVKETNPDDALLAKNDLLSMCRLYQMMYFPSGFWPQIITRLLADSSFFDIAMDFLEIHDAPDLIPDRLLLVRKMHWHCWQKQLELIYDGHVLFSLKEVGESIPGVLCNYSQCQLFYVMDGNHEELNLHHASLLEICFPMDSVRVKNCLQKQITARRNNKAAAKFLARVIEYIDNLLQDWYPELGERRFDQNCYGQYLLLRLIPCPSCLAQASYFQRTSKDKENWVYISNAEHTTEISIKIDKNSDISLGEELKREEPSIYCFITEECILNVLKQEDCVCPVHGSMSNIWVTSETGFMQELCIAPDIVFSDIDESLLIQDDQLSLEKLLGKGSFGTVYQGTFECQDQQVAVAVKILYQEQQRKDLDHHFKMEAAVQAYLTARQEVDLLQMFKHPNIVKLLGLVVQSLSLVLSLAPMGALNSILSNFRKKQQSLPIFAIKQVVIQIAGALGYLHSKGVIYRDLKSENVLVWSFPLLAQAKPTHCVDVKLADYGISRLCLPSGTKGFGGTPPFIAPEILQHAGKDIYNDKVDCFSFGMFMYELITCRMPLFGYSHVNNFICQGGRPGITCKESEYPSHFLDLIAMCWSQDPKDRPSATDVVNLASTPEFAHFMDAVSLETAATSLHACVAFYKEGEQHSTSDLDELYLQPDSDGDDMYTQVWLSSKVINTCLLEVFTYYHNKCVASKFVKRIDISALGTVGNNVWCVSRDGMVYVFSTETLDSTHQFELYSNHWTTALNVHYAKNISQVLIPFANGTVACCSDSAESDTRCADVPKILICEPSSKVPFCSTLVEVGYGYQLWRGYANGQIGIWSVGEAGGEDLVSFSSGTDAGCVFLVSWWSKQTEIPYVLSYNYPGTIITRWNVEKQVEDANIDCLQLSLPVKRKCVSKGSTARKCQVTAMNVINSFLYIGTTFGHVIVADCQSMQQLASFLCHTGSEFYVKFLLPLQPPVEAIWDSQGFGFGNSKSGLLTIGRGFEDPFREFVTKQNQLSELTGVYSKQKPAMEQTSVAKDCHKIHTFLLSWLSDDWQYY